MSNDHSEIDPAIVAKIWDKKTGLAKDVRAIELEENLRRTLVEGSEKSLGLLPAGEQFPISIEAAKARIETFIALENTAEKQQTIEKTKMAVPSRVGFFAQKEKQAGKEPSDTFEPPAPQRPKKG